MKTLSIDAHNVNITPNGMRSIILDVEFENEELDSLITDLDTDDIISAIGIEEILKTIDISDIICYLENCGYVVQFNN